MICKDCIHYDVCFKRSDVYWAVPIETRDVKKDCQFFDDKSRFIELPCKIGDFARKKGSDEFYEIISIHFYKQGQAQIVLNAGRITITIFESQLEHFEIVSSEEAEKKFKDMNKNFRLNDNRCLICGAIIPEGRQVCPNCENK